MNLFETLDKIYSSKTIDFVNDINEEVSPVVLNIMLSRYYKNSQIVGEINKYVFNLTAKQYAALAWAHIWPKKSKAPFVNKIQIDEEEKSRYNFILEKIKRRFEIGSNDWEHCKYLFLDHVKENIVDYLVFYGCSKKEWNLVGQDFEESRNIHTTVIIEGLSKWV